ncbi:unnamed protein product, partial [Laminaria digitata]
MADDFRPDVDDRIVTQAEPDTAPYSRRGRRIMTGLVAVAAVLGFGVVLVYAYNKGKHDGSDKIPPVIAAQEGPSKIRPENPGGMQVPNRDKEVFNRLDAGTPSGGVERLLPPPEKPMTPPAPPPKIAPEELAKVAPSAGTADTGGSTDTGSNVAVPLKPAAAPPEDVKPLAVTPPKAPAAAKPAAPPKKVAAKPPAATPKPAAKPAAPARAGAYRVQMASLQSR